MFHHRRASIQCGWSWDIHTTTCMKKNQSLSHFVKSSLTFFRNFCHQFGKVLYFKAFSRSIHKRVYSTKLRRNWNASMCVEKQTMQDLQRERSIRSSTWWLLFFAWWAPSFSQLWWLTKRFSRESLCNFRGEGFEFFDYWVTKNFVLCLWKENVMMVGFKCPMNFSLKNYI